MSRTKGTWRLKLPPANSGIRAKVLGPPHPDGSDYAEICETYNPDDAAFIVRACNNFDNVIAELKALITLCESHGLNAFYARAALEKAEAA